MAQDTLIVLCKTLNDAIMASSQVERRHDLNRLFIFLGKKPLEKDLKWMGHTDSSFALERVIEWGDNPELIGVRAGLMFANGWDLLFCWADDCPSSTDVDWVRAHLKIDGNAKLANIWGITRDHYILHGLGENIQQFSSVKLQKNDIITTGLQIANALDGRKVSVQTAISALREIVPISPLAIHESARSNDGVRHAVIEAIVNAADYLDEVAPISVLIGEKCTEENLAILRKTIASHGAIIQVTVTVPQYTIKPYRTIILEEDVKIALYGK